MVNKGATVADMRFINAIAWSMGTGARTWNRWPLNNDESRPQARRKIAPSTGEVSTTKLFQQ
ncbi:hypothetical protein [Hyphomicrobium sulfonivorans]|uniref:hypothetical protein n=1 Tax=Hyphomicrobium sulfonivorans TaxID=121290 RepID=UPI000AD9D9CC|nr:hypothetical protein [Hyphomicrobium sulfonivorans]MBI1649499.1 hypothetical protein [Hyphomicrobium sulfonivorans]